MSTFLLVILCTVLTTILYARLYRFKLKFVNKGFDRFFNWNTFKGLFVAKIVAILAALFFLTLTVTDYYNSLQRSLAKDSTTEYDEIAFLIDTSRSMATKDTSKKISRFERAKELVYDISSRNSETPISLFAFEGSQETIAPPTFDQMYLRAEISNLKIDDVAVGGTDFNSLFQFCVQYIQGSEYKKRVLFILLTDGEDAPLTKEKNFLKYIDQLALSGNSIFVIGLGNGDLHYAQLREDMIRTIAKHGKGRYFLEKDYRDFPLADVIQNKAYPILETTFSSEYFHADFFLLSSLFFILLIIFLPEKAPALALILISFCTPLTALENLETGFSYFDAGYYSLAREVFLKNLEEKYDNTTKTTILANIALTLCYENNFKEALSYFEKVDAEVFTSEEMKYKFFQSYCLCLIKEAMEDIRLQNNDKAQEKLNKAKQLLEKLPDPIKEEMQEEFYLAIMALKREKITLLDMQQALIAALDRDNGFSKKRNILLCQAIKKELSYRKIEGNFSTDSPLELALALDLRISKDEINKSSDRIETALKICLEAEVTKPLSGKALKGRISLVVAEIQNSNFKNKDKLLSLFNQKGVREAFIYINALQNPLKNVFLNLIETKNPSSALYDALFDRVSDEARGYLERAKANDNSISDLLFAWIIEDPNDAYQFLFSKVDAENRKNDFLLFSVLEFLEKRQKLAPSLERGRKLFINPDKTLRKLGILELAFALMYENMPVNSNRTRDGVKTLQLFEQEVLGNRVGSLATVACTVSHLTWVRTLVDNVELKREIDTLLALREAIGSSSDMIFYFHERSLAVLAKIVHFLQKEAEMRVDIAPSKIKEEKLDISQLFSRINAMQEDEREERQKKPMRVGDRGW